MKPPMYIRALELAQEIHFGQVRQKSGEPYVNHPIRISKKFDDDFKRTIALLHDCEDAPEFFPIIKNEFPFEVYDAVVLLAHDPKINYFEYIMNLIASYNPDVILVKIEDVRDNLSDVKEGSKADKYRFALHVLETAFAEMTA